MLLIFKKILQEIGSFLRDFLGEIRYRRLRILISYERVTGNFALKNNPVYDSSLNGPKISRKFILHNEIKRKQNFLDVGGGDGKLRYLLGHLDGWKYKNSLYKKNRIIFESKYHYFGTDLIDRSRNLENKMVIGDICVNEYLTENKDFIDFFDVIYSNNVFEHLQNPFVAMKNINKMLKVNGVVVTVVPFAARYHQSPGDYFRYTHQGLQAILSEAGEFETLISGYDITKRRANYQGKKVQDIVPVDSFGAWRENWDVINISMKLR